jgi:mannose-6-phosphate isomerase-like protein (cupin superfamily)
MITTRPWGNYEVMETRKEFQIKLISVNPGQRLSLQSHRYRSEHWIVIAGTAEVVCDENITILEVQDSIEIPLGSKHRVSNFGDDILQFIEIQLGSSFEEEDIVRYEDDYGRI